MKRVLGVGIYDAGYVAATDPFYVKWTGMLSAAYKKKDSGLTVCDEWLTFSKFKAWMEQQDWEGKSLMPILIPDSKVYSPESCCFVYTRIMRFMLDQSKKRGQLPVGVIWHKHHGIFHSKIAIDGKQTYLGNHHTVEEAFYSWLNRKRELAATLAEQETDPRIKSAIIAYYANFPIPDFSQYPTRAQLILEHGAPVWKVAEKKSTPKKVSQKALATEILEAALSRAKHSV